MLSATAGRELWAPTELPSLDSEDSEVLHYVLCSCLPTSLQGPSEIVNKIGYKCYSILIQSFVSYTSASGSEPSKLAAATAVGARRAPLARPQPRSPGMKWMAPPRSHPELPLLVEIGIEPCLGIVQVSKFNG